MKMVFSLAWRAGALLVIVTTLAGCIQFHPEPLSPAKSVESFHERSLSDEGLRSYFAKAGFSSEWPRKVWDFDTLVMAAFYYQPDLDVARAKWAVAQAGKRTAAERPNPVLSAGPSYNTTTAIPSRWLVTATLDLPIETAGKRGYRMMEASQLSEAARLNVAAVAWQVRSRLRRALLDLYVARESRALLKDQQAIQAETLRLLEAQHAEGAVSAFELTQARIATDSTRLVLRDSERQQAEAFVQVADAIGVPAQALSEVELSFGSVAQLPDGITTDAVRRQALFNRFDILGALAEYNAAEAALRLEIAKQYPDIHLNPGYEFDQGDNKWALGLSLTLPVFSQNKGPIAEAQAKRAEAAATFNGLQSRVTAEIDRAVAAYRITLEKSKDAEAMETNIKKQTERAQGMLDAGEISRSDLAALRLQLSASAVARLDAVTKSQLGFQQLEDALQTPLDLPNDFWQFQPRSIVGDGLIGTR